MSALDSGLTPARLPEGGLPPWKDHHGAKHGLIEQYLKVWVPTLGQSYSRTVLIDAFASAGRYTGGRRGSPLVMLDAYLQHSARDALKRPPHFIFIENELHFARHLKWEVEQYGDLHGAKVDIIRGTYWEQWPRVIDWLCQWYANPLPTFALIDPLGYKDTPFAHIELFKQRLPRSTEVMVYLPVTFMARFANTGQVDDALARQYGDRDWLEGLRRDATLAETSDTLGALFADALRQQFDEVTSFRVEPKYRNVYQLLFGTNSLKGLGAMKDSFWKVDENSGKGYTYRPKPPARKAKQAESLFDLPEPEAEAPPERGLDETNAEELTRRLREHFGTETFTIEDAELYVLRSTPFRVSKQLRQWALIPSERDGLLERPDDGDSQRGRRQYPPGTRLRFKP